MSDFNRRKINCLSKMDKSAAGRIDYYAVEICELINSLDDFYTTSSCAGRCLLWRGVGIKGTTKGTFERFRVNHGLIEDPQEYLDINVNNNIGDDSNDFNISKDTQELQSNYENGDSGSNTIPTEASINPFHIHTMTNTSTSSSSEIDGTLWLRCEPFILHVCCRTLSAAEAFIQSARVAFKNTSLQSWKKEKYMISIWGDDGLDMPITMPGSQGRKELFPLLEQKKWIQSIVNTKHERNWGKIEKLVNSIRATLIGKRFLNDVTLSINSGDDNNDGKSEDNDNTTIPRHFDILGDVALIHKLPDDCKTEQDEKDIADKILKSNKKIRVVALRSSKLEGNIKRSDIRTLGGHIRKPLMTTHYEFGVAYILNIGECFFSPRMSMERIRICNSVGKDENVLCLFSGIGAEALQIAVRTQAKSVVAIEYNEEAVRCAKVSVNKLFGTKKRARNPTAAKKVQLLQGKVEDILSSSNSQFPKGHFHRILAPRPKGVEPGINGGGGDGGAFYLKILLQYLKSGGECHWYDFAGKDELPNCLRSKEFIENICKAEGYSCTFLHVGKAGKKSIAAGQYRICLDFQIYPTTEEKKLLNGKNIINSRMLNSTSKVQVELSKGIRREGTTE